MRSIWLRSFVVLPATALVVLGGQLPALAHDPIPSSTAVARSKQHVRDTARQVGRLRSRLVRADARLRTLTDTAEIAVEHYNGQRVKLGRARTAYRAAQRRLRNAQRTVHSGKARIARLAAASYRAGSSSPEPAALVSGPGGPQGFLDRAQFIQVFSRHQAGILGHLQASKIVAGVFRRQARDGLRHQRRLARSAAVAKTGAQRAVYRQHSTRRRIRTDKRTLSKRLHTARQTAGRLAHRRTVGLRRERARAAVWRVAARRAVEHRTAHAHAPSSSAPASPTPTRPTPAPDQHATARPRARAKGDIAADWALDQVGKPYVWAAAGPDAYDCSGLTMRAWQHAGVRLDHWTGTQWTSGPHIALDHLHRGDLLLFGTITADPGTIHHVGIYIGHQKMVEAPHAGADVRVSDIGRRDLIGATRPAD